MFHLTSYLSGVNNHAKLNSIKISFAIFEIMLHWTSCIVSHVTIYFHVDK